MSGDSADARESSPAQPDAQSEAETHPTASESSRASENEESDPATETVDKGKGIEETAQEAVAEEGEESAHTEASDHEEEIEPKNDVDTEGDEDEDEDEEDDEDEEPTLKYARLTQHLRTVYRNGDATSSFLVAGDKMVCPRSNANRNHL